MSIVPLRRRQRFATRWFYTKLQVLLAELKSKQTSITKAVEKNLEDGDGRRGRLAGEMYRAEVRGQEREGGAEQGGVGDEIISR